MAKTLRFLFLGDFDPLAAGQSPARHFTGQFLRRVERAGFRVETESCPFPTPLVRLLLPRYDLVLVKADPPTHQAHPPASLLAALRWVVPGFRRSTSAHRQLHGLLEGMELLRDQVVLLTPLPQRGWLAAWHQRRRRQRLLTEAARRGLAVFDTHDVIESREEYFLPDDAKRLNATSHELLGSALYDYFLIHLSQRCVKSAASKFH